MTDPIELHALADGELNKADTARLREEIQRDPLAQAEFSAILNLKDCLRERTSRYESEECWQTCVGRLAELDRARKVEGFVGKYAWGLCAVFFALILGGRYAMKDVRGDSARTADLGHVFSSLGSSRPSATTVEQQQMVVRLLNQAHQAVDASQIKLRGGASGFFQNLPITRFDLRDASGPLAFYVISAPVYFEDSEPLPSNPGISEGVIATPNDPGGHVNCLIWNNQGQTLVLAGPRSIDKLANVFQRMAQGAPATQP